MRQPHLRHALGLCANFISHISTCPSCIPMMKGIVLPGSTGGYQLLMKYLCLIAGLIISNALIPARKPL